MENKRQFRHKKCNYITDTKEGPFYNIQGTAWEIHASIIEESGDWEEITPLFVADDGVTIRRGGSWYWVSISEEPKMGYTNVVEYKGLPHNQRPVKRFGIEANAKKFLVQLEKKVSLYYLIQNAKELGITKKALENIEKLLLNAK